MRASCVCPLGTRQPAEGRSACGYCGGKLAAPRAYRGEALPEGLGYTTGLEDIFTRDAPPPKPPDAYVPALLALVDALAASGLKPKTVRCGFLLFADCRDKVGARVEVGASSFERNGVKWLYDEQMGAWGMAIT